MLLRSSFAFAAVLLPGLLFAQTNTFDLHMNGKSIGHDTFTIAKSGKGVKLVSNFKVTIRNSDFDARDEFTFSETYAYLEGSQTDKSTNQQSSYLPDKQRKELTIAYAAAGKTSSKFIDIKPNLVVLPSFDAGAAQVLLTLATSNPTPDNHYTVFIPDNGAAGQTRSDDPTAAPPNPDDSLPRETRAYDSLWVKGGPLTGTLDGKPLTVNTYALAFGKFRWIFFADEQNNLLQVNVSLLHASYIRNNFKLDPPKQAAPH
jgi:hypothetical protein